MSHNAELKKAAEGAVNAGSHWGRRDSFERQLAKLATPEAVLALIAENERIQEAHEQICTNYNQVSYASEERGKQIDQLKAENAELGRYLCTCRDCGGEGSLHTGDWHSYSPMEPPEPVMEKCGECDGTGLIGEIQDLYQVITERDQLRAEVAGLKTGYEAYERVNAELKAENEALRKDAEQWRALVRRAESPVIGYTGCVTCGVYTDHGGLSCPKMRATADAALGQGEQS